VASLEQGSLVQAVRVGLGGAAAVAVQAAHAALAMLDQAVAALAASRYKKIRPLHSVTAPLAVRSCLETCLTPELQYLRATATLLSRTLTLF